VIDEMAKVRCGRVLGEDLCIEEGDNTSLYFIDQLRGYQAVLAALSAIDQDICHDGCSLPAIAKKVIKRLTKLGKDLDASSVCDEEKRAFIKKIDAFLAKASELPQDTTQQCRKTAGECRMGSGCFAAGAMEMMKQITDPVEP